MLHNTFDALNDTSVLTEWMNFEIIPSDVLGKWNLVAAALSGHTFTEACSPWISAAVKDLQVQAGASYLVWHMQFLEVA